MPFLTDCSPFVTTLAPAVTLGTAPVIVPLGTCVTEQHGLQRLKKMSVSPFYFPTAAIVAVRQSGSRSGWFPYAFLLNTSCTSYAKGVGRWLALWHRLVRFRIPFG